jgi:hypothetical protein
MRQVSWSSNIIRCVAREQPVPVVAICSRHRIIPVIHRLELKTTVWFVFADLAGAWGKEGLWITSTRDLLALGGTPNSMFRYNIAAQVRAPPVRGSSALDVRGARQLATRSKSAAHQYERNSTSTREH